MPGHTREGLRALHPPLMHDGPMWPVFAELRPAALAVPSGQPEFARLDPPRRPRRAPLLPVRSQE